MWCTGLRKVVPWQRAVLQSAAECVLLACAVRGAGGKGAESLGWLQPPFTEQARQEAQEMGIDLDDPAVQAQLRAFHEERQQPPAPSGVLQLCHIVTSA